MFFCSECAVRSWSRQGGQLVDHDQKLQLFLGQALLGPCSTGKEPLLTSLSVHLPTGSSVGH